jgi:hypothetical protein
MITTYDTMEEMLADMAQASDKADQAVHPAQAAIVAGDHVLRYDADTELVIYTQILPSDQGSDEEETEYLKGVYSQPHMKHYRFGKHYSAACPEGEYGDVHVSTVQVIISAEAFACFEQQDWPSEPEAVKAILRKFGSFGGGTPR